METLKRNLQTLIFVAFIVVSAIAGWSIPWFHEWSGTQQSHRSPLIFRSGVALTAVGIAVCFLLPGLLVSRQTSESDKQHPIRFRFTINRVVVIVALMVIWMGTASSAELAARRFLCASLFCYAAWLMLLNPAARLAAITLFSCMLLPYLWMALDHAPDRSLMQLLEMPSMILGSGFPAFVPQLLIGVVIDQRTVDWYWLGALLTAVQMRVGFWMIQHGPERTIAILVYSLLASLFGSFFLYEGMRV